MAGRYNFNIPGRPDASIVNHGHHHGDERRLRRAGRAGRAQLRHHHGDARHRRRSRAGNTFTLDFYGDKLITLGVSDQIAGQVKDVATGQTLKSLVTNDGKLKANGGRVELTAAAARAGGRFRHQHQRA